jgi:hypothetical protein
VLASFVEFPFLGYTAEDVKLEWTDVPPMYAPLFDGAEVTRFVARATTEGADMNVDPRFAFKVGIEMRRDPVLPLADTLHEIARRVFEVVTEIETGQPITPWLQYPLA